MLRSTSFFLAVECSGPESENHAIISLGAIAVDTAQAEVLSEWSELVQFRVDAANSDHLATTTYDAETWQASAVSPKAAADGIRTWMDEHTNRTRRSKKGQDYDVWRLATWSYFDERFFCSWLRRLGVKFVPVDWGKQLKVVDRCVWYYAENPHLMEPAQITLDHMCDHFSIECCGTAQSKASACFEVWKKMCGV